MREQFPEPAEMFAHIGRVTLAATLAYVAALWLSTNSVPLLAPLTALLVMQTTRYQTLVQSLLRVLAVVAGVLIALLFSGLFGFTWWSLAVIVAASLALGQLLRLGPHAVEVPVSAMLVLSLGAGETAVEGRVVETLVGAAAGILVNAAIGPPVRLADAGDALEVLADQLARLLRRMADEITEGAGPEQARKWVEDARQLDSNVLEADAALDEAEQSLRMNPRGPRTDEAQPALRSALETLEHCTVSARGLCRSLAERIQRAGGGSAWEPRTAAALSQLLVSLSALVRTFGDVVRAEPVSRSPFDEVRLVDTAEAAEAALTALSPLLSVDAESQPAVWALHGSLIAHVQRMVTELSPAARRQAREQWSRPPVRGRPATRAAKAWRRTKDRYRPR